MEYSCHGTTKPKILILGSVDQNTGKLRLKPRWFEAFNGLDVDLVPIDPTKIKRAELLDLLHSANGILLAGGDINVHPSYYGDDDPINQHYVWGQNPPKNCYARDRTDIALYMTNYAIEHKIPILGICLGAQEMNVAMGGKLLQTLGRRHVTPFADTDNLWDAQHHGMDVSMTIGGGKIGMMRQIFGRSGMMGCNSVHDQGIPVSGLAPPLQIEAIADDGEVVEVASLPGHPFFLVAQTHFEGLQNLPENKKVFEALVKAAQQHRQREVLEQSMLQRLITPSYGLTLEKMVMAAE